ncbi:DUF6483 family protein [Clostridium uliginosum]|uniref:Tetratricopeptide repeat-containing protein n=1 Tax=Clostridium uliginosum TaxID=119641 RepID=A0A1I1P9L3_9CLOT|nr:DUF6483 family protein [Clostridium uliginosum]SFD06272.1 hypothetical protein SAMN05421842_11855 [Clostridium uliginosum]
MLKNDYMKEMENSLDLVKEEVNKEVVNGDLIKAKNAINKQLKNLVGLEIETIDTLSFNSIEDIINRDSYYNVWKYIALGELLKLQGFVCLKEKDELMMIKYYQKSLQAFYKAYDEEDLDDQKYLDDANSLMNDLREYDLLMEDDKQIFKLYELTNQFDKAEDVLFYIIEKSNNDKDIILEGLEFYNRLKGKTKEILINGNLPENEVEDSYTELKKLLEKCK